MKGLRQKSNENWSAAEACHQAGRLNAAASRMYYSVFQAVYLSAVTKPVAGVKVPRGRGGGSKHVAMIDFLKVVGPDNVGRRSYFELRSMRETADYEPEPITLVRYEAVTSEAARVRDFHLKRAQE